MENITKVSFEFNQEITEEGRKILIDIIKEAFGVYSTFNPSTIKFKEKTPQPKYIETLDENK